MFNLLPHTEQQTIAREYRLRLTGTGLLFSASLVIVALVALIPSFILSYQKDEAALKADTALKAEVALESKDALSNVLMLSEKKATALSAETTTPYTYALIEEIMKNKISGIKIAGVSINRVDDGSHTATITGQAKDRETLLSFAGVLKHVKDFADVTVPVSDFAPVANIDFSILAKTK